jgi:Flp pilus assembly protein TadD
MIGTEKNRPGKEFYLGLVIFLLALTIRLLFQWEIRNHPLTRQLFLDPAFYDRWARSIADGDWLSRSQGIFYGNPLYPYFLAIIYSVFGHTLPAVRLTQSLLGSGTCLMLFLIGRRVFGSTAGILAGLLAAVYAPFIVSEGTVTISTLGLFLSVLTVFLLVRRTIPGRSTALAAGLVWGLRALARFDATVLAALAWLLGFPDQVPARRRILLAVIFCAGVCAVILPVTARNYVLGGRLVAVTAHGGETFYGGNNPRADGIYTPAPGVRPGTEYEHDDFRRLASQRTGRELSLEESSAYWLEQALGFIREHPGQWLRLELRKFWLFWSPKEIPDNRNFHYFRRFSRILRLSPVTFALLCPLALMGLAVGLRTWKRSLLIYLQVLLSMLSVLLFFVSARYRLPTVPFLILFAAHGLSWSYHRLGERNWRPLVLAWVPTMTLLIIFGWQTSRLDEGPFTARRETLAVALIREGRVAEGIALLEEIVEQEPERVTARYNLGVAYLEEGRKSGRALREFRAVDDLQSDYPGVHRMLAMAYQLMDHPEEAIRELYQELSFRPDDQTVRLELAMALVEGERWPEAEEQLRTILQHSPGQRSVLISLGNVLYLQGRWEQAADVWQRALEMDPCDANLQENLEELHRWMEGEEKDNKEIRDERSEKVSKQ